MVMTSRSDYEASICQRLGEALRVPFRHVSLPGWSPEVADCHANVDKWVQVHPECTATREWVTYADLGVAIGLTAHSVVRNIDGHLFDITPLGNEDCRFGMRFIPYLGEDRDFFALKEVGIYINCSIRQS